MSAATLQRALKTNTPRARLYVVQWPLDRHCQSRNTTYVEGFYRSRSRGASPRSYVHAARYCMKHFLVDFVTLLTVMNPVAVIPIYINLTAELQTAERKRVLIRAILVSFGILIAFLIVGEPVLESLGVTLNAFRIAGGIVLLILGMRMIFDEQGHAHPPQTGQATSDDIAVFPLAMPMIAGSGAILSIILLTENDLHALQEQASTALRCASCLRSTSRCFARRTRSTGFSTHGHRRGGKNKRPDHCRTRGAGDDHRTSKTSFRHWPFRRIRTRRLRFPQPSDPRNAPRLELVRSAGPSQA